MDLAAKAMALTSFELMTKPETLRAARAEFEAATGGLQYVSPLPEGAVPRCGTARRSPPLNPSPPTAPPSGAR